MESKWVRSFVRRHLVDVAPAEIDKCLDCGRLECSEDEFQACSARKARAAIVKADYESGKTVRTL